MTLGREAAVYPGDPPFSRTLFLRHGVDPCEAAELRLSAHAGTHLDLPAHYLPQGRRLDDYRAEDFLLPALVADTGAAPLVTAAFVEGLAFARGMAVLFKTANSRTGRSLDPEHYRGFVHLAPDAAALLASRGAALVGVDACSVEGANDPDYPVHNRLLSSGVLVLEGLHLAEVPAGRYLLCCAPLKIAGAEAAPVRALLFSGPAWE